MKKVLSSLFLIFISVFGLSAISEASTLDSIDIYLKYDSITQAMDAEQAAPTSISDAGEERIDTYTGGVAYYSEEVNLPGKNGLDLIVGRKFNSANDNHIDGTTQYVGVKEYRNSESPDESENYVFPYYLTEDCSGEVIFVAFPSIWHMLDAESSTTSITVSSDYEDFAINLDDTKSTYDWSIYMDTDIGLELDSDIYFYSDITGSDITLYRDTNEDYSTLNSSRDTNHAFVRDVGFDRFISLGGGWEYDIPTIISFDDSDDGSDSCSYGLFYDSYKKECVCFKIKHDDKTVLSAACYYVRRPISNSSSPATTTRSMYTIEAEKDGTTLYYTITRNDGMQFYCIDEELQSMTDRFGNTITFSRQMSGARIIITDTLGRQVVLSSTGIVVNNETVVSYSFTETNNDVEDPNEYYSEDNSGTFTAVYKTTSNSSKQITYNHSQKGRLFYLGRIDFYQSIGYSKVVLDSVELPTGAKRVYDYGEIERYQYFASTPQFDYACISRYDIQSDTATQLENYIAYDYGKKSSTPITITTFPNNDGYSISEKFDSEGCVTTRVITCEDIDYTITEDYTYTLVDGAFRVNVETVTKTTSAGYTTQYSNNYDYDTKTRNISSISRDGTTFYKAAYGDYGLPSYEYYVYGTGQYRGVKNTIKDGVITTKKYVTLSSLNDSSPTVNETVTYTYDSYGNIASVDGDGGFVEYLYQYGDYLQHTPDFSIIVTETYPDVENITNSNATDILSANITLNSYYDQWGNLVKTTDGEGNTTSYTYDFLGRLLTLTNSDNTKQIYSYNDTTNRIYTTDENGKRNMIKYDMLGRELGLYYVNETGTAWAITYYKSYDSYGNLMGYSPYRDGNADCTTKYTYYSDGSVKTERLRNRISGTILMENVYSYAIPAENTTSVSVARTKTDTEKVIITNYTNQYGFKLKDTISYNGNESEQTYKTDVAGNIKEVYDFNGNKAHKYTYDYRGRVLTDTYPIGSTTNVYSGAYLYQIKDALSNVIKTYEYNTAGQLIRETTPIDDDTDNVTEFYYDRNGNATKTVTTTGDGTTSRTITNIYDNRNRIVAANDGSGYYTRYEYDNMANVTRMATGVETLTEELDRDTHSVTDYEYSYRDFLVGVTDPMGYTESYTYNSRGTVTSFTDKNGTVINYTYNGAPWLLSKTATGINGSTQTVSYAYDYLGNVTQMVDENGTTLYNYNELGNVINETRGTLTKEYTYDANGNRTNSYITNGTFTQSLAYTYDDNNRLTKVTDADGYTSYSYDDNNRLLKKTYNNKGVRASSLYTYYDSGLLKSKKNSNDNSITAKNLIDTYLLNYYSDGNIATVENNAAVTSYEYDLAGRLTNESIDGVTQATYTYDAFGNRATMTNSKGVTTYTYDKNNRLTAENTSLNDGTTSFNYYCYNNDGTLQEKYWGTGLAMFNYDPFGKLIGYSSGGNGATYSYDGNGTRLSKTVNDITTEFINDGAYVVGEICGDNIVQYTYGLELISINNNGTVGYYHTDEHGSISAITDFDRNIVADYDFDAFGNETASTETYYNPMRYCGEYFDAETGLIYLRARYYDASIGRFIAEDPIKDGLNWYVYCGNNPIAFVDPSGEVVVVIAVTGSAGIGVGVEAQASVIVDDELDWAVTNSLNLSCSVGASASVSVTVFPTIDTVEEYINAETCSLGVTINNTGGAVAGATLEDGTEHVGVSVSVGASTIVNADVSVDGAITLATQVIKENSYK